MMTMRRLARTGLAVMMIGAAGCGGGDKVEIPKEQKPINDETMSSGGGGKAKKAKPAGPSGGES